MSAQHQLPEEPIRSKGQAILLAAGQPQLPAAIRDISASGIGVVAPRVVSPGTAVEIHVHSHTAHGTVESCRAQGAEFYIAIALTG